jgi:UDP-glucose 4-epimerase/UDP-glucuronate decarboxylase
LTARILVTGGAGFIGFHLSRRLAQADGVELTIVDNFSRGSMDGELRAITARPNVLIESADLTQAESWSRIGAGYDEVYHLAAVIGVRNVLTCPREVVRVNAFSTLHMLDWFERGGARKLLFSSTSEAYAWTQQFHALPVPTPEDVPLSLTDLSDRRASYAGSKIFGELAVHQYCAAAGKPFVVVRYHNIYGPRMGREHVIPELIGRLLEGQNPLVVYSAGHRRAFCYISDAVEATIAAMRSRLTDGRTVNIGNDLEEVTIAELATRIIAETMTHARIEPRAAENDPIPRRCPDLSLARKLLAYEPKASLSDGLARTIGWYEKHRIADEGASRSGASPDAARRVDTAAQHAGTVADVERRKDRDDDR